MVTAQLRPPRTNRRRSPALLPPGWPLYTLFVGFPLWWVLGLGSFIWPILSLPMLVSLLRRRHVRCPPGFGMWMLFLAWLAVSALRLDGADRLPAYLYRASAYGSVTVLYLYVSNAPPARVPASRLIGAMTIFWMVVVAGGYLGTFVPEGSFTTPVARIVPAGAGDESLEAILHPTFANRGERSNILPGRPVGRPAAPFPYTNAWGANFALLVPFALMGLTASRSRTWKVLIVAVLAASVVPVVSSLNRGLWLSLTIGLVYAAVRFARNRRVAPLVVVACTLAVAAAAVVTIGPIREVVRDRLKTDHSGQGRLELYLEAIAITMERPLLGYGSPVESVRDPSKPSVGTHGQFWLVLVSTGAVGAGFFLAWYGLTLRRTIAAGRGDTVGIWCHVVVAISLAQLLYYEQLPAQLHIVVVAAGLALRARGSPGS